MNWEKFNLITVGMSLGIALSALAVSFCLGCSSPTNPALGDEDTVELFETVFIESFNNNPIEPFATVSIEPMEEQETVTFDPYNTVSFIEPLDTVSLWPLGTDTQDNETNLDTSDSDFDTGEDCICHCHPNGHHPCHEHVNGYGHYRCDWFAPTY